MLRTNIFACKISNHNYYATIMMTELEILHAKNTISEFLPLFTFNGFIVTLVLKRHVNRWLLSSVVCRYIFSVDSQQLFPVLKFMSVIESSVTKVWKSWLEYHIHGTSWLSFSPCVGFYSRFIVLSCTVYHCSRAIATLIVSRPVCLSVCLHISKMLFLVAAVLVGISWYFNTVFMSNV